MATAFHRIRHGRLYSLFQVQSFSICQNLPKHTSTYSASEVVNPATQLRRIATTSFKNIGFTTIRPSWIDKIKGFIPGIKKKDPQPVTSFTLENYADELNKARKVGSLAQFARGRSSEVTLSEAFEKQEAIIRVLASYDSTGEHLEAKHKADAAKHCNCTVVDVENALSKFTWAKAAQKKIEKLKEEGKPLPKNLTEVQQLVGTSPIGMANSSLAKSGQISRNADCPCGSKKKYKRCCGKT